MWGSPGPKRLTHRCQSQVGGSCKDWKYGLTGKLKILGLLGLYHPFFCAHPIKMLRQNKPGSGLNGHGVKLLPAPAWSCVFNFSHTLCWIFKSLSSFHTEVIAAYFFWGNVRLRGWLRKDAKKSNFENFESTYSVLACLCPWARYLVSISSLTWVHWKLPVVGNITI